MRTILFPLVILLVAAGLFWLLRPEPEADVVLYCGVDQDQSQPIAQEFTEETGLTVRYEGEIESARSIGLPGKLREEKDSPKADVFWSNEIMNMVDLGRRGLLAKLPDGVAERFPPEWRDPQGEYVAFGARARILLVNTELLPDPADHPTRVSDLLDPRYEEMGYVTAMARPLTGTTYTHAVALLTRDAQSGMAFLQAVAEAGKAGRMKITVSNGGAMRETSDPENGIAFCLTDTDDARAAIQKGWPVKVVYPDQGEDDIGTVLIPNTVALIKGGPHPEAGAKLLEWLVAPENELRLASGPSAQIPLNPSLESANLPEYVMQPGYDFAVAEVDWQKVGENRDKWHDWLVNAFRQ
jgi:iron(III) transport system substrate-binding protein